VVIVSFSVHVTAATLLHRCGGHNPISAMIDISLLVEGAINLLEKRGGEGWTTILLLLMMISDEGFFADATHLDEMKSNFMAKQNRYVRKKHNNSMLNWLVYYFLGLKGMREIKSREKLMVFGTHCLCLFEQHSLMSS